MIKNLTMICIGISFVACANAANVNNKKSDDTLSTLRTNVETPHFVWKNSGKPLNLQVMLDFRKARGAVELAQRRPFNLLSSLYGFMDKRKDRLGNPDHLLFSSRNRQDFVYETTDSYIARRFNEQLPQTDVLFVEYTGWKLLSETSRKETWLRASNGMGIVFLVSRRDREACISELEKRGYNQIELNNSASQISQHKKDIFSGILHRVCFDHGQSRVAVIDDAIFTGKSMAELENRQAEAIKTIEYVSPQKESVVAIELKPVQTQKGKKKAAGKTYKKSNELSLSILSTQNKKVSTRLSFMAQDGDIIGKQETACSLKMGMNTIPLEISPLPAGKYLAIAQIIIDNKIATFACCPITVTSDIKISLAVDKTAITDHEAISGTITLTPHSKGLVRLKLIDFHKRVLTQSELAVPSSGECSFHLDPVSTTGAGRYQKLVAELIQNDRIICTDVKEIFRLRPYDNSKFRLFSWHANTPNIEQRLLLRYMRDMGQSAWATTSKSYFLRLGQQEGLDTIVIENSFSPRTLSAVISPMLLAKRSSDFIVEAEKLKSYGNPWALSFVDEPHIQPWKRELRLLNSDEIKQCFLSYLRDRYKNISLLNSAWKTDFPNFESIKIPTDIDVPREPLAPWMDYARFIEVVFTKSHVDLARLWEKISPGIPCGFDGIEDFSPFEGVSADKFSKHFKMLISYPYPEHPTKEFSAQANMDNLAADGIGGYWLPYGPEFIPEISKGLIYRALFQKRPTIGYFTTYTTEQWFTAFYPDWRPKPAYKMCTKEAKLIQRGIDKLLMGSERKSSPIAIHYSELSALASFPASGIEHHLNQLGGEGIFRVENPKYKGNSYLASSAMLHLLHDIGYQPKLVPTRDIEAGALKNYNVLMLPFSQVLTGGESKAIRRFVENGGILIADYGCGIRDENGNLREDGGSIDTLFGIHQKPLAPVRQSITVTNRVSFPGRGNLMFNFCLPDTLTGGPLELIGAPNAVHPVQGRQQLNCGEGKDQTPVMIINLIGKGAAIYLNFALDAYIWQNYRIQEPGERLRDLFKNIVEIYGKTPLPVYIERPGPRRTLLGAYRANPECGVERTWFQDGDAAHVGLLWNFQSMNWTPHQSTIVFPYTAWVYDTLNQKEMGKCSKVTVTTDKPEVRLFSLLPYKVEEIKVSAPSSFEAGETWSASITVNPGKDNIGRHVVSVALSGPDNREISALPSSLVLSEGKLDWKWQPAVSVTPGTYEFVFRDVVSGVATKKRVEIKKRLNKL